MATDISRTTGPNRRQRRAQGKVTEYATREYGKLTLQSLQLGKKKYHEYAGHRVHLKQVSTTERNLVFSVDPTGEHMAALPVVQEGGEYRAVLHEIPIEGDMSGAFAKLLKKLR